jgi:hypothetical protein
MRVTQDRETTMRRYIRHPSSLPIEFAVDQVPARRERLKNVGGGGLCFHARVSVSPGSRIHLVIPVRRAPFELDGIVTWCRNADDGYEVGVSFQGDVQHFVLRMVEQICYIEHYRREMLEREGRELTSEEAAREWIERYADRFPGLDTAKRS